MFFFRFTIRELMLLTVIAALGAVLWVEHSKRLKADSRRERTANRAAKLEEALRTSLAWQEGYKLALDTVRGRPEVGRLPGIQARPVDIPLELRD